MRLRVIFKSFEQAVKLLYALLPHDKLQEVMQHSDIFQSALETMEEFQWSLKNIVIKFSTHKSIT